MSIALFLLALVFILLPSDCHAGGISGFDTGIAANFLIMLGTALIVREVVRYLFPRKKKRKGAMLSVIELHAGNDEDFNISLVRKEGYYEVPYFRKSDGKIYFIQRKSLGEARRSLRNSIEKARKHSREALEKLLTLVGNNTKEAGDAGNIQYSPALLPDRYQKGGSDEKIKDYTNGDNVAVFGPPRR